MNPDLIGLLLGMCIAVAALAAEIWWAIHSRRYGRKEKP